MITFDSLLLNAFIRENLEFLTDSRIQKIQQPTRRDFILTIRKTGETRKLYINIVPRFQHICFMSKENETRRRIEIPAKPPMFCMLLRKYLENAKICRVNQPPHERILEFYVETYNEVSEKICLCLAMELMGKHSNIILYNCDTNIILGCAHNVGAEKSREREMSGTIPYTYPPKQYKTDILTFNGEINPEKLDADFYMFSKPFAELCKGKNLNTLKNYIKLENISPAISADYEVFCLFEELLPEAVLQKSVNDMIDNYFTHHQEKDKFYSLRTRLLTLASQRLKKTTNSLKKMQTRILKEADSAKYRLFGDLIMANLYSFADYSDKIEVYDYENNKNITIELDSTKTLKENAGKFYKLYNKAKTSKLKLTELSEEFMQTKMYLEHIEYSINRAETFEELLEIKPELIREEQLKDKKPKNSEPEKITKGEYTIFIGKNNRQNDFIISKLAKDEDLWFHVKGCAGSHVLLKGENPDERLVLECVRLAKKYSSASNSSKAGVIYTKRKYLRKPPKANPGYVTYKNEKEIIID